MSGSLSRRERKEAVDRTTYECPDELELYEAFDYVSEMSSSFKNYKHLQNIRYKSKSDACKGSNDNAPSSGTDCQKGSWYEDKAVLEILGKAVSSYSKIFDPFYKRIWFLNFFNNKWFLPEYGVFGDPIEFIIHERTYPIVISMISIAGLPVMYCDDEDTDDEDAIDEYAISLLDSRYVVGISYVDQLDISPAMQLFVKQVAAVRCARKRFVKLVRSENIADCYKTKCKVRYARQVNKSKVRKAQSNRGSSSGKGKAGKSSKASQAQSNKGVSTDKNKPGKDSVAQQAQSNSGVSQGKINAGKGVKAKRRLP